MLHTLTLQSVPGLWDAMSQLQKRAQESDKAQRTAFKELASFQDVNKLWFMDESSVVCTPP